MKELKSKQRAYLMKLASSLEPIFQIGKSSLTVIHNCGGSVL